MKYIMNVENGFIEYLNSDSTLDCYLLERGKISSSVCATIEERAHGNNVVYFLFDSREPRITESKRKLYIGETTNVYNRMIGHNGTKDWWTNAIIFTGDKRKINEVCVMALENLLIEAYKSCGLYDLMNSQSSCKDTDGDDYDTKMNYIFDLLDVNGYPIQIEKVENKSQKDIDNISKTENKLYLDVEKALEDTFVDYKYEQLKLYRNYYVYVNNKKVALFALWPSTEAELYIPKSLIEDITPFAYDISNRKRGNRKSAIKIKNQEDMGILVSIASRIIERAKETR